MPYCPSCGKSVAPAARFCESCGFALGQAVPQPQSAPPAKADLFSDPVIRNYKPVAPTPDLPFRLQEGEVILKSFKPNRKVIVKFAFGGIIASLFILLFAVAPLISVFYSTTSKGSSGMAMLIVVGAMAGLIALILLLSVVTAFLGYRKYSYWITNHRTIGRRGIIGYTTDSMPLENVADVVVSRGILDRILGLSSIYIQPIGGAGFSIPVRGMGLNRLSGTNNFQGLNPSEAPDVQQLIFHLRDLRKRETGRVL